MWALPALATEWFLAVAAVLCVVGAEQHPWPPPTALVAPPPAVTAKNVRGHCQIHYGGQNHRPPPGTTDWEQQPSSLAAQRNPLSASENIGAAGGVRSLLWVWLRRPGRGLNCPRCLQYEATFELPSLPREDCSSNLRHKNHLGGGSEQRAPT